MSEMIGKVQAALRKRLGPNIPDRYLEWAARDAIQAMREPTQAMLRASPVVGTGLNERGEWAVNTKPAQDVWLAMIDAALAEGKG